MQIRFPLDAGKRAIPSEQFSYRHCVTVPAIATRSRSSAVRRRLFLRFPRRTSLPETASRSVRFSLLEKRLDVIGVALRTTASVFEFVSQPISTFVASTSNRTASRNQLRELPRSSVHSIPAFSAIALVFSVPVARWTCLQKVQVRVSTGRPPVLTSRCARCVCMGCQAADLERPKRKFRTFSAHVLAIIGPSRESSASYTVAARLLHSPCVSEIGASPAAHLAPEKRGGYREQDSALLSIANRSCHL